MPQDPQFVDTPNVPVWVPEQRPDSGAGYLPPPPPPPQTPPVPQDNGDKK